MTPVTHHANASTCAAPASHTPSAQTLDEVTKAASALPWPPGFALSALASAAPALATELTRRLEALPDLEERLIGPGNRAMMADNHANHFRYISSLLPDASFDAGLAAPRTLDPAEFVATLRWVVETYLSHGFRPAYWETMLPEAMHLIAARLPEAAEALRPWYRFMQQAVARLAAELSEDYAGQATQAEQTGQAPPCRLDELGQLSPLARRYLELTLAGSRREAASLILGQAQAGHDVRGIYLDVLKPALRALGLLWQHGRISVAEEHFTTASTQMVMSQLFPFFQSTTRNGHTFVGCCVAGEVHEVGMRMVSDLLELDGFDTWYLGANTPDADVLSLLAQKKAAVLGISATMSHGLPLVERLIRALRADERTSGTRVLVGGLAFARRPGLWHDLGADGCADDAAEAVALARRLVMAAA